MAGNLDRAGLMTRISETTRLLAIDALRHYEEGWTATRDQTTFAAMMNPEHRDIAARKIVECRVAAKELEDL